MRPHGNIGAHRGASLELPDNSMAAFSAALSSGCEVIETDVRLRPHDRSLVLAHDDWQVDEPGVVELAALLELADGRVSLDLEVVELGLERLLLDAIDGFAGTIIVTSVYAEVIAEVTALMPAVPTGYVIESPASGGPAGDPFELTDACGAGICLVEDDLATPTLIARAGHERRPLWVWTVNDLARAAQLLAEPAVTGVITDDPAMLMGLRRGSDGDA